MQALIRAPQAYERLLDGLKTWCVDDDVRLEVPALAIYAVPKSADDLMRRGSSDRAAFPELVVRAADDPAIRERAEKLYQLTRERVRTHAKWFEAFAERGRVVELSGHMI